MTSGESVKVSCSAHGSHEVSVHGYKFLEAIEGALGTTQQAIELVEKGTIEEGEFLDALVNRLARGGVGVEASVKADYLDFSMKAAHPIHLLMKHCQVEVRKFVIVIFLEWDPLLHLPFRYTHPKRVMRVLRKALSQGSGHQVATVRMGKREANKANREDLRAVWDATTGAMVISPEWGEENFEKERGEEGWQALEKFIDGPDRSLQQFGMTDQDEDSEVEAEGDETGSGNV